MDAQVAVPDVGVKAEGAPPSVARATARIAGAMYLLAIILRIPDAWHRTTMVLLRSDSEPLLAVLPGVAAVGLLFLLYGIPATWLLRGHLRHRAIALLAPFFTAAAVALVFVARVAGGGPGPSGVEAAYIASSLVAPVVLLTGRPSRVRLRVGAAIGVLWLVLSLVVVVGAR